MVFLLRAVSLTLHPLRLKGKTMRRSLEGSSTVELALIFPISFLILILLIQMGLHLTFRLYADNAERQAALVCKEIRRKGGSMEDAAAIGDAYLKEKIEAVPCLSCEWEWQTQEGFLRESFTVSLWGNCRLMTGTSWHQEISETIMDPAVFRNRVDLVKEVIKEVGSE